jgi:fatty-acyl-CoA synthase
MRWTRVAQEQGEREALAFVRAGEPTLRWTWRALLAAAEGYAARLAAAGVRAGHTCAIISRHHFEFYPLYLGVCRLGALPSVLAYPNERLHPDKFRAGLLGMVSHSGLDFILTEAELSPQLQPLAADVKMLHPYDNHDSPFVSLTMPLTAAAAPALLQHSSGTTGLQKAVVLSHRAILQHVTAYGRAIAAAAEDRIVSWLPLYHDMGLITSLHLPLALGIPAVHIDPFEWVLAPALLLEVLAEERGTLSWLPNFAYSLLGTRVRDAAVAELSLQHVRLFVNCSEPIRAESQRALANKLAPAGVQAACFGASYAMAEATFAVTQTPLGRPAKTLLVSRAGLEAGQVRAPVAGELGRECVSSGEPIRGTEIKLLDKAGDEVAAGHVGELSIRAVTMFEGYRNRADLTDAVWHAGWYRTGDLGFVADGEWYIVGRAKELIIVAGKNLYPQDIEAAVEAVPGASAGRSVAFGRFDPKVGTEHVCVILETSLESSDHAALRKRVIEAVRNIDITLSELHVVPPRWLIKSSSGKPSRGANRERIDAQRNIEETP